MENINYDELLDWSLVISFVTDFFNHSIPIIKDLIQQHNDLQQNLDHYKYKDLINLFYKGILFSNINDEKKTYSFSVNPHLRLTPYSLQIIWDKVVTESRVVNFEKLKKFGFQEPIFESFSRKGLLEVIIRNCCEELIDPNLKLNKFEPLTIKQSKIKQIVQKVLDLDRSNQIELEFLYIIYNVNIEEKLAVQIDEISQIIPKSYPNIELISNNRLCPDFNFPPLSEPGTFEVCQFLIQSSGWIVGKKKIFKSDIAEKNLTSFLQHPWSLEQAFQILGFRNAKVRIFYNFSEISNIGPIYTSYQVNQTVYPTFDQNWYRRENFLFLGRRFRSNLKVNIPRLSEFIPIFQKYVHFFESFKRNPIRIPPDTPKHKKSELKKQRDRYEYLNLLFYRFSRIRHLRYELDFILEAAIIIESLISQSTGDLTFQFKTIIPILLCNTFQTRKKLKQILNLLYSSRSKIVHEGGGVDYNNIMEKLRKKIKNPLEYAYLIVHLLILRFFTETENDISFLTRDQINSLIENLLFQEENIKSPTPLFKKFQKMFIQMYFPSEITSTSKSIMTKNTKI